MRRAKRRHANEPRAGQQHAADRVDARHLERGLVVEERQDPGQPAREHRLPRAGRPGEQEVVPSRRGDLERPARPLLAAHVGEVGNVGKRFEVVGRNRRLRRVALAAQIGDGLGEVAHADRLDSGQSDLGARLGGTDEMREAGAPGSFGGDERAGNGPQTAVESELADRGVPLERLGRQLVGRCEHGQSDREIEPRPLLAERRRREVDGDAALGRPLELGGGDAAAHTLLRLLAGTVGEADDGEGRHTPLQMRFDLDPARIDADERVGDGACEHTVTLGGRA